MILTMNNFEFENNHYQELQGTAIGTKISPAYANLFMGDLEQKILAQSPHKPLIWWHYIDDVLMIWPHGEEKLNEFVNLLNSSHEAISSAMKFHTLKSTFSMSLCYCITTAQPQTFTLNPLTLTNIC